MKPFIIATAIVWILAVARLAQTIWCISNHKEFHNIVNIGDTDEAVMVCSKCKLLERVKRKTD